MKIDRDAQTTDFAVKFEANFAHAPTLRNAGDLMAIIERADLAEMFAYALSTPHRKSVVAGLTDSNGDFVGDLIVSFIPNGHVDNKSHAR